MTKVGEENMSLVPRFKTDLTKCLRSQSAGYIKDLIKSHSNKSDDLSKMIVQGCLSELVNREVNNVYRNQTPSRMLSASSEPQETNTVRKARNVIYNRNMEPIQNDDIQPSYWNYLRQFYGVGEMPQHLKDKGYRSKEELQSNNNIVEYEQHNSKYGIGYTLKRTKSASQEDIPIGMRNLFRKQGYKI